MELTLNSTGKTHNIDYRSSKDADWALPYRIAACACGVWDYEGMFRKPQPTDVKCKRCFKS